MSTLDPQTLRRELLLEEALNRQLDALVRQANLTVVLLKTNDRMEKNQLRNLLNVAVESRSVEVVINFVRYQIARNESAWGKGEKDFGHQVIADVRGEVKRLAKLALDYVQKEEAAEAEAVPIPDALHATAYVRLVQLYLGYVNRAFYYAKTTGEFDKLKEVADAR